MLGSMASSVGITSLDEFISSDGLLALTLASGGVPRDYLNILVDAVDAARALGQARVTPRSVYRGAGRVTYRTKLSNLRSDAGADSSTIERVYRVLAEFCLKGKKKTGFLVAQSEVNSHTREHEVIQQLMDFKLIHVIESDTSAVSGRSGRFEAYTLDFALFMEPRLRGVRHIQFWRTDQQRRREGVREAPVYRLDRARDIMQAINEPSDPEALREEIAEAVGVEPSDDSVGGGNESD
jgi:hypothetical protein